MPDPKFFKLLHLRYDSEPRGAGGRSRLRRLLVLFAVVVLAACGEDFSPLGEPFRTLTPHERYAESLRESGLDSTALGGDWLRAARQALRTPVPVRPPLREAGYFPADEARAVGYRIFAERGQRLTASVEIENDEPTRVFVDLFTVPEDTTRSPERVASAEGDSVRLEWEPSRDGSYLLRLQPELLRGGRYTVTIRSEAALAFPVEGRDTRAIQSFFGAERDGGRREHHGVDIFAPRGTPAIAAAAGIVSRVQTTPRGGEVVWLRDSERGQNLYYAHLDSQTVTAGTRVQVGDTLGLVGNTGNARTTPPHLHFGIYKRGEGPVDPYPFVYTSPAELPALAADTARLGDWVRVDEPGLRLRASPSLQASIAAELPLHTPLRVAAAAGKWYRVVLPDGQSGYVYARSTEPADVAIRRERLTASAPLRDRPAATAVVIDNLGADVTVPVLGRFDDFLLVEGPDARTGWLLAD